MLTPPLRGVAYARFTSPQVLAFLLQCYAADVVAQAGVTGHAHKADLNLDALADSVAPDGPGLPPPRAIRKKPRPRKTHLGGNLRHRREFGFVRL